jgi:hypothetical protein
MSNKILTKLVEQYAPETVKLQLREMEVLSRLGKRLKRELQFLQQNVLESSPVSGRTTEKLVEALKDSRANLGYDLDGIMKSSPIVTPTTPQVQIQI